MDTKKPITKIYRIKAPISEVWRALTDVEYIEGWGGGPAEMDDKAGSEFSLWGGDIHGKNIEVKPSKKLVQEWYGGKWQNPSILTFELKGENGGTMLTLTQTDVPEEEYSDIDAGWDDYYLGPLKEYLESK